MGRGSMGEASMMTPLCGRGGLPVSMFRSCLLFISTVTPSSRAAASITGSAPPPDQEGH